MAMLLVKGSRKQAHTRKPVKCSGMENKKGGCWRSLPNDHWRFKDLDLLLHRNHGG